MWERQSLRISPLVRTRRPSHTCRLTHSEKTRHTLPKLSRLLLAQAARQRRWITSQCCSPEPMKTHACHIKTVLQLGYLNWRGWKNLGYTVFFLVMCVQVQQLFKILFIRHLCFTDMFQYFTFINRDDVWVAEGWHNLNLSADVHHVLLILDLLLPNWFDSYLETEK